MLIRRKNAPAPAVPGAACRGENRMPDGENRPDGEAAGWRSNRAVALILLVAIGAIGLSIWQTDWAHRVMRDGFTLGGFPLLAVGVMAVCSLVLIVDHRARLVEPDFAALTLVGALACLAVLGVMALAFWLFFQIGFGLSVALFVSGLAVLLGYRPVWIALASGVGTAAFLSGLAWMLGVTLPQGGLIALIGG